MSSRPSSYIHGRPKQRYRDCDNNCFYDGDSHGDDNHVSDGHYGAGDSGSDDCKHDCVAIC